MCVCEFEPVPVAPYGGAPEGRAVGTQSLETGKKEDFVPILTAFKTLCRSKPPSVMFIHDSQEKQKTRFSLLLIVFRNQLT